MTSDSSNLRKTVKKSSAEVRNEIVDVMNRVRYAGDHIEVARYKDRQAVIVPVEWYERACEALGEGARLPSIAETKPS